MAANKKCAWWNEMLFKLLVGFSVLCSGDIICLVERCEHHHHNHQKYALWMHDSDKEGSRIQQFKAMNLLQSVFYEMILTLATKILCCNYNGLMSMYVRVRFGSGIFGRFVCWLALKLDVARTTHLCVTLPLLTPMHITELGWFIRKTNIHFVYASNFLVYQ